MGCSILFLGYGNVDRQDDGVAWHILDLIGRHFGLNVPDPTGEGFISPDPVAPTDDFQNRPSYLPWNDRLTWFLRSN